MSLTSKKYCNFELKESAEQKGIFTGYASVFNNIDSDNDVIVKGAFANSLAKRKIKLLWQHKTDEPIGLILEANEDDTGLYVKCQINLETEKGAETYSNLKMGILDKMSIGFKTLDYEMDKKGVRILTELDLYEISIVTFPANDMAEVDSVKNSTSRDVEKALRDVGYSQKNAKHIISMFGIPASQRDVGLIDKTKEALLSLELVKLNLNNILINGNTNNK
jgi:HK97 family phage prohead protease